MWTGFFKVNPQNSHARRISLYWCPTIAYGVGMHVPIFEPEANPEPRMELAHGTFEQAPGESAAKPLHLARTAC